MPDQVGTSNVTITTGESTLMRTPFVKKIVDSDYSIYLSPSVVYKDTLYITPVSTTANTESYVGSIYSINVNDFSSWSVLATNPGGFRSTAVVFDDRTGTFYCLGGMTTSNSYNQATYAFEANNPNGWRDSLIANITSTSLVPCYNGYIHPIPAKCIDGVIYYSTAHNYVCNAYIYETPVDSFISSGCVPKKAFAPNSRRMGRGAFAKYGDYFHVMGGIRTTATDGSSWSITCGGISIPHIVTNTGNVPTTVVDSYHIPTSTWSTTVVTPLPTFFYGPGTTVQCGSVVYLIDTSQGLAHYYDLNWSYGASWRYIAAFPKGVHAFDVTSLAFDRDRSRLLLIENTGAILSLKLDPYTNYPAKPIWEYEVFPFGMVSTEVSSYVSPSITIGFGETTDRYTLSNTNIAFTISTAGLRILSHTVTYYLNMYIPITSTGSGIVNEVAIMTPDIIMEIQSIGFEGDFALLGGFAFQQEYIISIESSFIETIAAEIELHLDTEVETRSLFGNLANLSLVNIDTVSSFSGSVTVFGSFALTEATSISLENNGIEATLSLALDTVLNITGELPVIAVFALENSTFTNFNAGFVYTSSIFSGSSISKALCMNLHTSGVSEYTNYVFNSYFVVGGVYYGCNSDGVFALNGDLDNAAPIAQSVVVTGTSDFNTQKMKSLRDSYIYIRSAGDMHVTITGNEQVERGGYPLYYDNIDGIHRRRVKVAQGLRGTTWQAQIRNTNGVDFTLKQLDLIPYELDRSV